MMELRIPSPFPQARPVQLPPRLRAWLLTLPLLLLLALRLLDGLAADPPPPPGDPAHLLPPGLASLPVRLQGVLLADPAPAGGGQRCSALVQLEGGRSEALFQPCPPLRQNWRLELEGSLRRPAAAPHPLLAGAAERLARQRVYSQLRVERWRLLERRPAPIAALRRRLAEALQSRAGAERGGLLAALVVGNAAAPLPLEIRAAFRAAGLSHALAASGFQLSVLLGALLPLARRLGLPAAAQLGIGGGMILLFVLLAGPQAAVLRAALMAALALLLLALGRQGRPLRVLLAVSLLMLLWQPQWLRDVGFQLSVVATAALLVSAGPLEQVLRRRHCPGWLAVALAVPLAASLWTLPLQLLHFGVVPLYAVPANLLAAPLLTPLTLGAMALALVALLLPPALPWLVAPLAWLAGLLLQLARTVAALPMAQWQLGRPVPLLVLLLALGLAAWLVPGVPRLWRRGALLLLALATAAHLSLLWGDQLLLVHQGVGDQGRDLLVARHRGRGALVATRSDPLSCRQAGQLAAGLGLPGFDWVLLLDPLPPPQPACWRPLAGLVLASADGSTPLRPGQKLASAGLEAGPISLESRATSLEVGGHRWLLLPDPQALWSWREGPPLARPAGVWLGFRPRSRERHWLDRQAVPHRWQSGQAPPGWRGTGAGGWLQAAL
jgi:competence protein ComEC